MNSYVLWLVGNYKQQNTQPKMSQCELFRLMGKNGKII